MIFDAYMVSTVFAIVGMTRGCAVPVVVGEILIMRYSSSRVNNVSFVSVGYCLKGKSTSPLD